MAAPAQLFGQADLEAALTGEKLKQLLADNARSEPNPARVQLVIDSGTGFVLGLIQKAVKNSSIDVLWDTVWTERDKAELRRLALSAGIYYAHFYGQKGEELPESVVTERDYVETRCREIGDHTATLGSEPTAASSPQHDFNYGSGAGHYEQGSPRSRWRGF